jgi:hypothetical protein
LQTIIDNVLAAESPVGGATIPINCDVLTAGLIWSFDTAAASACGGADDYALDSFSLALSGSYETDTVFTFQLYSWNVHDPEAPEGAPLSFIAKAEISARVSMTPYSSLVKFNVSSFGFTCNLRASKHFLLFWSINTCGLTVKWHQMPGADGRESVTVGRFIKALESTNGGATFPTASVWGGISMHGRPLAP